MRVNDSRNNDEGAIRMEPVAMDSDHIIACVSCMWFIRIERIGNYLPSVSELGQPSIRQLYKNSLLTCGLNNNNGGARHLSVYQRVEKSEKRRNRVKEQTRSFETNDGKIWHFHVHC